MFKEVWCFIIYNRSLIKDPLFFYLVRYDFESRSLVCEFDVVCILSNSWLLSRDSSTIQSSKFHKRFQVYVNGLPIHNPRNWNGCVKIFLLASSKYVLSPLRLKLLLRNFFILNRQSCTVPFATVSYTWIIRRVWLNRIIMLWKRLSWLEEIKGYYFIL